MVIVTKTCCDSYANGMGQVGFLAIVYRAASGVKREYHAEVVFFSMQT
jgi:hypothetical protein